jgi:hypothetical protein
MRTVEAVIDETGQVHLLEPVRLSTKSRALVTILENEPPAMSLRPFGLCEGDFVVPDDFDAPLPEEILKAFETE